MAKEKVDLKKFLEDPSFQEDRELLGGFVEDFLTKKAEAAAKKKADDEAANPPSIFDRIFGGR